MGLYGDQQRWRSGRRMMDANQLSLTHHAKLPPSFHSARWRHYNPDLAVVTSDIAGQCKKIVMDPIPQTQYRPIGIQHLH